MSDTAKRFLNSRRYGSRANTKEALFNAERDADRSFAEAASAVGISKASARVFETRRNAERQSDADIAKAMERRHDAHLASVKKARPEGFGVAA